MSPQIESTVFAVEILQTFDERRRDDQSRLGEMERIANHQAGLFL